MKKILIILMALAAVGCALYFFVFSADDSATLVAYSPGDYFVTNIKDSNRLLKTSVVLEVNGTALLTALTNNNALVRDTIIFILRDLSEDDVRTVGIEDSLRQKICETLNSKFATDGIVNLYYSDFVMQ